MRKAEEKRIHFSRVWLGILMIILMSCAQIGINAPDTPEKKYLAASEWFNASLARYAEYAKGTTAERRAWLKEKVNPLIYSAAGTLSLWELNLKDEELSGQYESKFLETKNRLIDYCSQAFFK